MPRWYPLKYTDGEITIVRSPSLWDSPLIRQYHLELLKVWQGLIGWPPEREVEIQVYDQYGGLYKSIADLLVPQIFPDRLSFEDRFKFFVCTEPFEHPAIGPTLGLSELSKLMGYEIAEKEGDLPEQTTGDSELDLYVDLQIVFKTRAKQIAKDFSPEDCAKMLVQANWRMTPPEEQKKQSKRRQQPKEIPPPSEDRGEFVDNKEGIETSLKSLGVQLPGGW